MPTIDRLGRIYNQAKENNLLQDGYTEERFRKEMKTEEGRKGFYDFMSNIGALDEDYTTFSALVSSPEMAREEVLAKMKEFNETEPYSILGNTPEQEPIEIDWTQGLNTDGESTLRKAPNEFLNIKVDELRAKGEDIRKQRIAEYEEAFANRGAMSQMNYGRDMQELKSADPFSFLDENDTKYLGRVYDEVGRRRYENNYDGLKADIQSRLDDLQEMRSATEDPTLESNTAAYLYQKAIDIMNIPSKFGNTSGLENFNSTFWNNLFDRQFFGVTDLNQNKAVENIVTKLNNNEELMPKEIALIDAFMSVQEAMEARAKDMPLGAKIGEGAAKSAPFMVDMILTEGLTGVGKRMFIRSLANSAKAANIAGDAAKAERLLAKAETWGRRLGGSEGITIRSAEDASRTFGALKQGEKVGTKGVGQYVAREAIETPLQTAMMPSSWNIVEQDKINKKMSGEDFTMADFARSFGNAYVETLTERAGGKFIDWGLGKIGAALGATRATFAKQTPWVQMFTHKAGSGVTGNSIIQSPIGENGEEYLGALINYTRASIADKFGWYSAEENEQMREEARYMFTKEGFLQTFGTVLPMSLVGGALNIAHVAYAGHNYNGARQRISELLIQAGATKEQAEDVMHTMDVCQSEEEFADKCITLRENLNALLKNDPRIADAVSTYKAATFNYKLTVNDFYEDYLALAPEQRAQADKDFKDMKKTMTKNTIIGAVGKEMEGRVNEDDKMVYEVTDANGRHGFVKKGNVDVFEDKDGVSRISPERSEQLTIQWDGASNLEQVGAGSVTLVSAPVDMETYADNIATARADQASSEDMFEVGDAVYAVVNGEVVPDVQPSQVVSVDENGVTITTAEGVAQTLSHEQAQEGLLSGRELESRRQQKEMQEQLEKMKNGADPFVGVYLDKNDIEHTITKDEEGKYILDGANAIGDDKHMNDMRSGLTSLGFYLKESAKPFQESAAPSQKTTPAQDYVAQHGEKAAEQVATDITALEGQLAAAEEELAAAQEAMVGAPSDALLAEDEDLANEWAGKKDALAAARIKVEKKKLSLDKYKGIQAAIADGAVEVSNEQQTAAQIAQENVGKPQKTVREMQQEIALRTTLDKLQQLIGVEIVQVESLADVKNEDALREIHRDHEVKGWYDDADKKAYLYMPNVRNVQDAVETIFHESVAHKGIREVLGETFKDYCHDVFDGMMPHLQKYFAEYAYNTMSVEKQKAIAGDTAKASFRDLNAEQRKAVLASDYIKEVAADEYMANVAEECARKFLENPDVAVRESETSMLLERFVNRVRGWLGIDYTPNVTKRDIVRMITASRLGDKREYFVQKQAEQLASKEPQVVTNEVGEVVATTDGKGHTGLSVKNYDDCRGMLVKYLDEEVKNGNITAADRYAMLKELNDVYETAKALADGDPKSLFGQWSYDDIKTIADIVDKYGNPVPVMHAIKSNAEYALNIDFSTVCKKRMEIDRIMNKLIADGTLTNEKLSPQDIARINQIIQSHGLEIACEICFVDSRRYNAYTFAEGFNHKFNHLVASLAGYEMPFVKGKGKESKKRIDERTDKLADAAKYLAGYNYSENKLFDEENKDRRDLSKETNETFSIAKAILAKDKKAAIRGYKLNWGGIYDCLNPLLNKARKVMAEPTFKADFAAYCKEAGIEKPTAEDKANYAFSQVPSNQRNAQQKMALAIAALPHLRKLTKSEDFVASTGWVNIMQNNKELETLWNIQKGAAGAKPNMGNVQYQGDVLKKQVNGDIFDIAGYRMQSFSDFIGRMWFDYMQAFADLSAKRLPGHAYTKEPNFVKLFGLMGMKINMSLVFAVDTKNKVPAGLTLDKNGNLTYNFHRTEKDEKTGAIITQGQTFPPEDAFILQDEPEYTKNCGTIAVGLSDEHILMMLKDQNIRMVIPYHKSGLPHGVALIYDMNEITDYTDVQSTKANILDKGKYSTEQKKKINNTMHKRVDQFNFMLHQLSIAEDKVAAYNALRLLFVEGDASKVDMHDEYKRIYNGIVSGEITEGLKKVEPSEKAADKDFLPKLAANIYLEACEKYDYSPKFCGFETKDKEGNIIKHADLTKDENYYKVLIDFAVYDAQGNYTPQEVIKFNTPSNLVEIVKGAMAEDEDFNAKGNEVLDAVCGEIGGYLSNDAIRKEQDRIAALKDEQITPQQRLFMGGGLKEMNKYQYNVGDGRNIPTDAKMTAEIVGYNMEKKQPDETNVQYAKRRSSKDPKTLMRIEFLGVPYTGSKSKVAIPIVSQLPGGKRFVDLFCGGGAVTHAALLSGKYESVLMNDKNPIGQQLFLDGIDGKYADYNKTISREEFKDIARTPESLLWSYASNSRSYQGDRAKSRAARVNALQALAPMRKFISTEQMDYRDVVLQPGDVIYADIPYKGTDTSAYGAEPFDYDAFYAWALDQDEPVYVSEYSMPDGFTEVWSEEVNKLKGGNVTERLFVQSKFANDDNTRGREAFKTAASESFFKARNNEMSVDELLDEVEDINNKTINNEGVADAVERVRDAWSEQDMDFIDNADEAVNELEKGVFGALDGETRMRINTFHGSPNSFDKFDFAAAAENGKDFGYGVYVTTDEGTGVFYQKVGRRNAATKELNRIWDKYKNATTQEEKDAALKEYEEYDNLITETHFGNIQSSLYKVSIPDDNGNVIPLSERFNENNADIRFRMTPEEEEKAYKIAKEEFGTTTDWKETGWLLGDGTQLDFSEKNNGGPVGVRTRDHRDIYMALPSGVGTDWRIIKAFEGLGNIRVSWMGGQYASVEMSSMPTKEQLKKIREFVSTAPETTIEFMDENYNTAAYGDYTKSQGRKAVAEITRFYEEGINPTTRFRITPAEDAAYLDAVERGDMETAKKMVMEAAKKAGYTIVSYHGTENGKFTQFDTNESDDKISIFSTDEAELARTYSGTYDDINIGEVVNTEKEAFDAIENAGGKVKKVYTLEGIDDIYDSQEELLYDYELEEGETIKEGYVIYDNEGYEIGDGHHLYDVNELIRIARVFVRDYSSDGNAGNYPLLLKFDDPLVIDARGSSWNEIYKTESKNIRLTCLGDLLLEQVSNRPGGSYPESIKTRFDSEDDMYEYILNKYDEDAAESVVNRQETEDFMWLEDYGERDYAMDTREIAMDAKEIGHDGVVIKNVWDNGKYAERQGIESTVYISFDPKKIKSADPVTYDDNGNVIPLSERFNESNADIRFRTTWHGSAADFDKFDRAFSGTGEGQAVMGDGIYVAEKKGVAEYYATTSAQMKRHVVKEGGYYVDGEKDNSGFAPAVLDAIENSGSMDAAIKDLEEKIGLWKGRIGLLGKPLDTTKMEARLAWMKEHKDSNVEYQEEVVEMPTRNLYQVEIPDDNGRNYLNWDGKVSAKVVNDCRLLLERELDAESPGWLDNNKDILDDQWKYVTKNYVGATLYDTMRSFLVNKSASDILQELGFVGIKGEASHDSQNYVIFNEDNAKIVDHTRFRVDPQSIVDEAGEELLNEEESTRFRIRTKPEPKENGIGYKVFYTKNGKLYPPMVANPNGEDTPVGVWLDADAAPIAGTSKTGRLQVKNGGKGTQGGSGTLSYRPGWHLGEIPYALQFNRKDENGDRTLFPKDFVWAEVEYARDNNYQEEAMSYGYNKNGKFQHSYAGLPRVPEDGFYMYRTNPNPQTDPWIITGAMRVKKVLTKDEVDELVRKAGREPQRVEGDVRFRVAPTLDENEELYNYEERMREFRAKYGEEMADKFEEVADIDTKHLTGKQLADLIMLMGKMHSDSMDSIRDAQQKVSKRISAVNERIFLQGMVDRGAVEELVQLAKMFIKSGWADEAGKRDIAYIVSSIQKASRRASSAELEDAVNTLVDAMVHANVKKMASIMHDMMSLNSRKNSAGVPIAGQLGTRQHKFIESFNKYIGIDSNQFPNRMTELNDKLAQYSERIARFEELDGKETLTKEEEDDKKRLDKTIENDYIQYNRINDEIISIELADAYKTGVVTNEDEVKKISNNLAVYRKALEYLPRINEADAIKTELLAEQERLEHILADETIEGREKTATKARLRGVENRLKGLDKLNEIYAAKDEDAKAVKNTLFSLINTEKTAYRSVAMNLIDGYVGVSSKLSGIRKEGKESYADWLQQERDRKERIRHYWRSDRKGQPYLTEELRPLRGFAKDADKLLQFMESPVKSFLYMLKDFSVNAPEGKGYLYNHFCYGLMEAEDKYWTRKVAAMDMLDKKATELFGKKRKVVDSVRKRTFIEVMNNESQTNIKFTIKEGENDKPVNYTAGQLMYLYQVNKMADGREKLEAMGWTEENVAAATQALKDANENFIALADYIQQEFLPTLRKEYEKTFERMFGTAMPYIENYVPLQISDVAIDEVVDLNDKNGGALPSTVTKNLISRVRNTKPIALESVDMLELILSHVNTMEHWNAFAEVTRDLNTLLSDRAFKNSINAGLGNTRHNYEDFKNVCKLAVGCYEPSKEDGLSAIIKKVGGAKVAFRWFTALKQLLSFPAFMDNIFEGGFLLYSVKNLVGSVKWGKENLPSLNKRWESRFAGDENLDLAAGQKNEFVKGVFKPWVWLQNHIMRHAMIANSGIDLITCAWGARSVYDAKRTKYIYRGYSVEEAERRAKLDAEIAFNETQQSSEGMFLSAMQKDRDFINRSISLFNNSSFAYGRKFFEGIRESWRSTVHAKERYEFRKKQLMRDGLTEEKAEKFAIIDEAQAIAKGVLDTAIFGWVIQTCWNIGGSAYALLFSLISGDDEKKKRIIDEAAIDALIQPVRGLPLGASSESIFKSYISTQLDKADLRKLAEEKHWSKKKLEKMEKQIYSTVPSDRNAFLKYIGQNVHPAADELAKLAEIILDDDENADALKAADTSIRFFSQFFMGVDAGTLYNVYYGFADMVARYDDITWVDVYQDLGYVLNAPPSQVKYVGFYPRPGESAIDYRNRYVRMKILQKYGTMTPWVGEDVEKEMNKKYKKKAREERNKNKR